MTAGDSVENYREATAAEKSQYEQEHQAGVQAPAQWLIDWWNREFNLLSETVLGRYNPNTNFFEAGAVKDIGTIDAIRILVVCGSNAHCVRQDIGAYLYRYPFNAPRLKAFTPVYLSADTNISLERMFAYQALVEQVQIVTATNLKWHRIVNLEMTYVSCSKLKEITGVLPLATNCNVKDAFYGCDVLEEVKVYNLAVNIDFQWSPLLSAASLAFMVENATNTSAISIKVHADVFAKLNDADNADYHPILATATAKQISFVTP